jgi:hypothetical protein
MEGYRSIFDSTMNTVWSAPNYCYRYENLASILEMDEHLNDFFNVFTCSPENAKESKDNEIESVQPMTGGGSNEFDYFV